MFGRLTNSAKGRTGQNAQRPQYYALTCPDGHALRGMRTDGYQAVRCPTCGLGLFVLPRSPLPDPPAPPEGTARRRGKRPQAAPAQPLLQDEPPIEYVDAAPLPEASDDVEIVWLDQPPAPVQPPAPLSEAEIPAEYRQPQAADPKIGTERPTRRRARASSEIEDSTPAPDRPRRQVPDEGAPTLVVPRPSLARRLRNHGVAAAVVGALAIVACTVAYRTWRGELDRLPQVADVNFNSGKEALSRGEFDAAKQMLARAATAFERLGGKDERSPEARQLANEAAIFADLSSKSLKEILDEAALTDPAEWPRRFEINHQGRSIIVDSEIQDTPIAGDPGRAYQLALRLYSGRGPNPARAGTIDLTGMKLFAARTYAVGDPVIFGARLEAVEHRDGEWRIRLQPESGVLITDFDALAYTGWSRELTAGASVSDAPRLEAVERKP